MKSESVLHSSIWVYLDNPKEDLGALIPSSDSFLKVDVHGGGELSSEEKHKILTGIAAEFQNKARDDLSPDDPDFIDELFGLLRSSPYRSIDGVKRALTFKKVDWLSSPTGDRKQIPPE
jgi:hypothetical protein